MTATDPSGSITLIDALVFPAELTPNNLLWSQPERVNLTMFCSIF